MTTQSKKKLATRISAIFNPGIVTFAILILAVIASPISNSETFCWIVAIFILNGVIPGLLYEFFTSRGYVFDDTLHNQKVHRERVLLFGTFLVLIAIELLIMVVAGNPYQPLLAVLICGALGIIIAGSISYFWKMSMHSTGITFFIVLIMLIYGCQFWPLVFLLPFVWWARIVLYRHTIWQLIGGCIFSLIIVSFVFNYFGLL